MKGQKTGGRIAGTPNRLQSEEKERLKLILGDYLDAKIFEDLEEVDATTRLNFMAKLFGYVVPKQSDVKVTKRDENQLQGPMGELSRMTAAQMIKARPDLVKLMLDGLKELEKEE
jgi:uncharacterized protein (DUF2164 family)